MVHILARRPQPNHDPVLLTKAKHATIEDAYRPGPIPLPKSLNKESRTRALEQIVLENEKFLQRLIASPGVYRSSSWSESQQRERKYLELLCKFPYVDPSTAMPASNPMLAIANAQSNQTAEMILRNQQALAAAQMQASQQQQQQSSYSSSSTSLPQIQAGSSTGAFGSTHNSFGSTFGSTTGSHALPPMQPSATGSSAVPNHFPMPPSAASASATSQVSPSPPGTAGSSRSLVPVQPHSARPATTQPQPPQVKLRAQYTSQGVRIIKTGRRGGGTGHATARPATSLDPLRPAAPSSSSDSSAGAGRQAAKTFQPLRTQQLQTHQRQQSAAAASEAASIAAASKAKHEESKEEDSANAAAASTGPAGAPAPPLPLFEDTLLISGRPVLVRLFEVSAPPRFEIAVFDPYSSLEYALSLPFTFVRLCFYQVPDLLLPHNRSYLVQTLLHYLVFAPAGGNASGAAAGAGASTAAAGLELLVDIVAPPPRNAVESAAWKSVQAEAALEQQAWELANEKEAARARREAKAKELSNAQQTPEEKTQQSDTAAPPASSSTESQSNQQEQSQSQSQEEPSIVIQRVSSNSSSGGDGGGGKEEASSIVVTPPTPADDSTSTQQQAQPQTPSQDATPSSEM